MLGFCTNVYNIKSFNDIIETMNTEISSVKRLVDFNVGIGLWLPNSAIEDVNIELLRESIQQSGVSVFTSNGFPMNDFHANEVKHDVYKPTWAEEARLNYTVQLATILAQIIETDNAGISTVPLGWDRDPFTNEEAAKYISKCVDALEEIANETGKLIHLDLEAEPGCRLQTSADIASFVQSQYGDDERIRQFVRVCHDTCHAAVMRETAESCIANYQEAGLAIGKVQLSSAIATPLNEQQTPTLMAMHESRYLHQTTIVHQGACTFYEDLNSIDLTHVNGDACVHFHVPIHADTFGSFQTKQADIKSSIPILQEFGATDWEIETYTWHVIPEEFKEEELSQSIAKELEWAERELNN